MSEEREGESTAGRAGDDRWDGFLAASLLVISVLTLTPTAGREGGPFVWRIAGNSREALEVVLNVLLFMPFGAALRLRGSSFRQSAAAALALTLIVETAQHFAIAGRSAELRDLIANTLGGMLGWLVMRPRLAADRRR